MFTFSECAGKGGGLPSAYASKSTRVGCDFFFIHRAGLLSEGAQTGGRFFRKTP